MKFTQGLGPGASVTKPEVRLISTLLLSLTLIVVAASSTADSRDLAPRFGFETTGRVVASGSHPQLGVRASGDLFLLRVVEHSLWLQTSADGGDSFSGGVRINDVGEAGAHAENSPIMVVRSMREFYVLWATEDEQGRSSLRLSTSTDWGRTFNKSVAVDATGPASQAFYTMSVGPDGAVYVAWLDGRDRGKGSTGSSALYIARSTNRGQAFEKSVRIALDVCPCCRPSIAFTDSRTVHVGWRGVIDADTRDIFVATSRDGANTFGPATRVAEDNWKIDGCPHSGPSLAALKGRLYVAWRTVSAGRARIYMASSSDSGSPFSAKTPVDSGLQDPNHPQLVSLDDSLALVFQAREATASSSWQRFDIFYREIGTSGVPSTLVRLGHAIGSATYPLLLPERPDHLFALWSEGTDEGQRIVMARGRLGARSPLPQGMTPTRTNEGRGHGHQ